MGGRNVNTYVFAGLASFPSAVPRRCPATTFAHEPWTRPVRDTLQITMRSIVITLVFSVALATASQSGMLRANSNKGREGPQQSGKEPFKRAKLDLGVPPKTIPGEGFDFFKKANGLEKPDHFGVNVQRHTPYAELYLLCPTHSCLRERRTLVSAKDPVETKFVTLADYECFNAKDGTVSQPYNPEKKDHGEAPAGLHRWSCHSKFDCKAPRKTWIFATAAEGLCDQKLKELNDGLHKLAKLDPFESWFVGDLGVSETKVENHTAAVKAYEDAMHHQKEVCLSKSHWEHVAGPLLSIEAYADAAHIKANEAAKTLSAAKERLNNAQMGKLDRGEQWYISRGVDVQGLEKLIHRALAAKKKADERWGKFEMQAEKADVAGPGIFRALRHARKLCNLAKNQTRDALAAKDEALEKLRVAEGKMLDASKKHLQPQIDKIKATEKECSALSEKAEASHSEYHRCRLGDPDYLKNQHKGMNHTNRDMHDDESGIVKRGETKALKEAENEDNDSSGPEGEKETRARELFETGGATAVSSGTSSATGEANSKLHSLFKNTIMPKKLDLISEGKELEEKEGMDSTGDNIHKTVEKHEKMFNGLPDKATRYKRNSSLF